MQQSLRLGIASFLAEDIIILISVRVLKSKVFLSCGRSPGSVATATAKYYYTGDRPLVRSTDGKTQTNKSFNPL
ncbi:hypothetical protein [Microcoleus sp. herbarium2]|uniref:hypothetical protein n=1 Tax=Microcoleus sp. herbarium2 TaxID=3055433 RepID=UPI002FD07994